MIRLVLRDVLYYSYLFRRLRTWATPTVVTPIWRAHSAIEIPTSSTRILASSALTAETWRLRPPAKSISWLVPPFAHVSSITFRTRLASSRGGSCLLTFSSASARSRSTNSPPPSTLSSLFSSSPLCLIALTPDHPPCDRINPPPTNSGRLPRPKPSLTKSRYASLEPNHLRT